MNNINGQNVCGRCGTAFEGTMCPSCGLVICVDNINDNDFKLKLVNEAYNLIMRLKIVPDGTKLNDSCATFYYMTKSIETGEKFAAFKITGTNIEVYFNFNKTLQCLKPEGREMYEREFNEVRRIHRITETEINNPAYKVSIYDLKNFGEGVCKSCGSPINPYDIICKTCHKYLANDFPNDYKDYTLQIDLNNYMNNTQGRYLVTFVVPENLQYLESENNQYLGFVNNTGPAFISYRINTGAAQNLQNLINYKEETYLGKRIKTGYQKFDNGDVIYIAELQINNDMYGIMEYQIGNAKSVEQYNEDDFKKYIAILMNVQISGEGYQTNNIGNNSNNNDTPKKKTNVGLIIGIVVGVLALLVGAYFAITHLNIPGISEDTMKTYTFVDRFDIKIPSSYKAGELTDYDTLGMAQIRFEKEKCYMYLDKDMQTQMYNLDTFETIDTYYTKDTLYPKKDIKIEEITLNGRPWYYTEDRGTLAYIYIDEKDPRYKYTVEFIINDPDYCKVKEIINSVDIK